MRFPFTCKQPLWEVHLVNLWRSALVNIGVPNGVPKSIKVTVSHPQCLGPERVVRICSETNSPSGFVQLQLSQSGVMGPPSASSVAFLVLSTVSVVVVGASLDPLSSPAVAAGPFKSQAAVIRANNARVIVKISSRVVFIGLSQ